jgi:cell volume regulation protein A
MPAPAAPDPQLLGDFFVPGEATLGALAEIYGVALASHETATTLAAHMEKHLGRPTRPGDVVPLGAIALLAHKVADGRVSLVGLRLAEPDPKSATRSTWMVAIRRVLRRARAVLRRW